MLLLSKSYLRMKRKEFFQKENGYDTDNEKWAQLFKNLKNKKGHIAADIAQIEETVEVLMDINEPCSKKKEWKFPCPECPMCLEKLMPPKTIMQCGSGHIVCQTCESRPELTNCPKCRQAFTGRAIAMEQYIATLFSDYKY